MSAPASGLAAGRRANEHPCMLVPTTLSTLQMIAYARRYLMHTGDFANIERLRQSARSVAGYPKAGPSPFAGRTPSIQELGAEADRLSRALELDLLLSRHGVSGRRFKPKLTALQQAARAFDRETETTVYFARSSADASVVKIGHSANPAARMQDLHYIAGDRVWPMLTLPGGHLHEQHLHQRFKEQRLGQEWFQLDGPILAFVRLHEGGRAP